MRLRTNQLWDPEAEAKWPFSRWGSSLRVSPPTVEPRGELLHLESSVQAWLSVVTAALMEHRLHCTRHFPCICQERR